MLKSNRLSLSAAVALLSVLAPASLVHAEGAATKATPTPAGVSPDAAVIDRAMQSVYPALVRIKVVTTEPVEGRLQKFQSAGSGCIISKDGHIITNHHVAGKARQIVCDMPDGERIEATLVGSDPLADIAVIKLKLDTRKDPSKPLPVATFGDSDSLRVGDVVLAMGSPAALSQSVTRGIVSNTRMILPDLSWSQAFRLDGEDVGSLVRWIGHDAQIFGGNSGGPLVNLAGEVIGVNDIGIGGLGGAIPGNLARDIARQIIDTGEVKRSWVGMASQPRLSEPKTATGVLVSSVIEDGPAGKAGLKPGDIITEYDGTLVDCSIAEELPPFNRLILSTPVGQSVPVKVMRDGKPMEFTITTLARESVRGKDEQIRSWGVTARDLTRVTALELQRPDKKGVLIQTIRPGGPCGDAKPSIEGGDVITEINGHPIENVAELRAVSAEITKGKDATVPTLVAFDRNTRKMLTVVRIGKESDEESPISAKKAWLPVTTQALTSELADALGLKGKKGVRVTQVYPPRTGAAESALKVGDIVLKMDGEVIAVSRPEENENFTTMVRRRKIGEETTLDIVRDGAEMQVKAALETPPTPASEVKHYKDTDFEFSVRDLTTDDRVSRKLDDTDRGVLIDKVEMAGWAALARVGGGDILLSVNNIPTPDIASLKAALKKVKDEKARRVVFFVRRGIHTVFLELEPNWEVVKD